MTTEAMNDRRPLSRFFASRFKTRLGIAVKKLGILYSFQVTWVPLWFYFSRFLVQKVVKQSYQNTPLGRPREVSGGSQEGPWRVLEGSRAPRAILCKFFTFFDNFWTLFGRPNRSQNRSKTLKNRCCFSTRFSNGFLDDFGDDYRTILDNFSDASWNTSNLQKSTTSIGFCTFLGFTGFQKQVENRSFSEVVLETVFGRLWGSVLEAKREPKTGPRLQKIDAKSDHKKCTKK